ncbi:MAG: SPOR domain-containing protein [Thermodesulfobacteriota bacterium]
MSSILIVSLLFLGVSVSTSWLVNDTELDTLSHQLKKSTVEEEVLVDEVEALQGEIARKDNELANVNIQIMALKKSRKQLRQTIEILQDEQDMGQVWKKRYGELDTRFNSLAQRAEDLAGELETALLVKTAIERQLRSDGKERLVRAALERKLSNEEKLRREALVRISQLEHNLVENRAHLATADADMAFATGGYLTGGVAMRRKDAGKWWKEEVLMYKVKDGDSLARTAALNLTTKDGKQLSNIYSCSLKVNDNAGSSYPKQLIIIPPVTVMEDTVSVEKSVSSEESQEMEEASPELLPETKPVIEKDAVKSEAKEAKWAINLASLPTMSEAEMIVNKMGSEGGAIYITEYDDGKNHWYRVRTGFYPSKKAAASDARELAARLEIDGVWVVLPSKQEIMSHSHSSDGIVKKETQSATDPIT